MQTVASTGALVIVNCDGIANSRQPSLGQGVGMIPGERCLSGYMGIMEKKMETIIMGYIHYILRFYRANGRENGNHFNGLYSV